ncbi:hypothetical protein Scep_027599 [Stephania cephalantha]|uniref:Uncharacterized protein n=1 Tax=Stephania cephalantha TaxID=152367 RepID=A0AAP0ECV2_9MAGN
MFDRVFHVNDSRFDSGTKKIRMTLVAEHYSVHPTTHIANEQNGTPQRPPSFHVLISVSNYLQHLYEFGTNGAPSTVKSLPLQPVGQLRGMIIPQSSTFQPVWQLEEVSTLRPFLRRS